MEVCRGDMYYVYRSGTVVGSEQDTGRPAVIVSNNIGNEKSEIVECVFLTTQEKRPMPTHVEIMCKEKSTALCEQINTISKERLGDYIGACTKEERNAYKQFYNRMEIERDTYKQLYNELVNKIVNKL